MRKTSSERYNDRMEKIYADARRLERERLARGEMPNPSLTSPEEAREHGWEIVGRDVRRRGGYWADVQEAVELVRGLRIEAFKHLYDMSAEERAGDEILRHATAWLLSNRRRDESLPSARARYRAERYDYEKQAWIGTDGRWMCCSHPQEMFCQCYGRAHAGELARQPVQADIALPSPTRAAVSEATVAQAPALSKQAVEAKWQGIRERLDAIEASVLSSPTINEWPEQERRGYDAYARELAHVEWVMEQERKGAYGRQPVAVPIAPERADAIYTTVPYVTLDELAPPGLTAHFVAQAAPGAAPDAKPALGGQELAQTWGEWIDSVDERQRQAWDEEVDEIYAAEELERAERAEDERRNDR